MTNHWRDIKNADVILVMGSNAAENHPVAFKWVMEAKEKRGATIISVDPRFTRSSSKADIYAPLRSGTDIAFLGGMINYAISRGKINTRYLQDCTNALYLVHPDFQTCRAAGHPGLFSGWDGTKYATTSWDYQYEPNYQPDPSKPPVRVPKRAASL
ncbi:MAG: molybdopterin-dependent oxidoreductase, partial [Deltaproteobacteria bacterium]